MLKKHLGVGTVKAQLFKFLKSDPLNGWSKWILKWSKFTLNDLMRSTLDEVLLKLKETGAYEPSDETELSSLSGLIPWSSDAVSGFRALNFDISLATRPLIEFLRFDVGKYLNEQMYTIQGGPDKLPQAFLGKNVQGRNTD